MNFAPASSDTVTVVIAAVLCHCLALPGGVMIAIGLVLQIRYAEDQRSATA